MRMGPFDRADTRVLVRCDDQAGHERRPGTTARRDVYNTVTMDERETTQTGGEACYTIYYDGDCPICALEIRNLRRLDDDGRLDFVDVTAPAFDAASSGKTREELLARMHARRADGSIETGMQVFRGAYERVGKGWMVRWTGWPGVRQVFDWLYLRFANNRERLGGWLAWLLPAPRG
ncbi:MAG: DUF393 domain-containing protein [Gammaproteobacteria bacterium]|nr:DUF393 domain-containing protein [Gammaproteobacteria bacterium]NNM00165.1 DUF393 domain-containing protein [Gammaproteobacteria bacterium]